MESVISRSQDIVLRFDCMLSTLTPDIAGPCRYDTHGKEGVDSGPAMDPAQLFGMIFGSDVFEDYIGELQMAMAVSASADLPEHHPEQPQPPVDDRMQRAKQHAEIMATRAKLQKMQVVSPLL